jgi:DNA repair protein RadC
MHNKPTVKDALKWSVTALDVLSKAADIISKKLNRNSVFSSPQATKDFLTYKLAPYEREVFCVLLLDSQHRLIEFHELFFGTIDATAVYPREVVKLVLEHNAAAVIFAHNHPSGVAEPSMADKNITQKLTSALALIDVRVLDHIVVGETQVSFAERGLI